MGRKETIFCSGGKVFEESSESWFFVWNERILGFFVQIERILELFNDSFIVALRRESIFCLREKVFEESQTIFDLSFRRNAILWKLEKCFSQKSTSNPSKHSLFPYFALLIPFFSDRTRYFYKIFERIFSFKKKKNTRKMSFIFLEYFGISRWEELFFFF